MAIISSAPSAGTLVLMDSAFGRPQLMVAPAGARLPSGVHPVAVVAVPRGGVARTTTRGGAVVAAAAGLGFTSVAAPPTASSMAGLLVGAGGRTSQGRRASRCRLPGRLRAGAGGRSSAGVGIVCAAAPGGAAFAGGYASHVVAALPRSSSAGLFSAGLGGSSGSGRFRAVVVKAAGLPAPGNNADDSKYNAWKGSVIEQWEAVRWTYRPEAYVGDVSQFKINAEKAIEALRRMMDTKAITTYPEHCKNMLLLAGVNFHRLYLQAQCGNVQVATVVEAVHATQMIFPQIEIRDPEASPRDTELYFKQLSDGLTSFVQNVELLAELSEHRFK